MKPVKSQNLANGDNIDENPRPMSATSDADMRKLDWQPDEHPNIWTHLSHLKIYNGTYSDESIWRLFLQPFPFLLSPVVRKHLITIVRTLRNCMPRYPFARRGSYS